MSTASDVASIALWTVLRANKFVVVDNALPMSGQGASNSSKISNCHDAPVHTYTALAIARVEPWTVSPCQ